MATPRRFLVDEPLMRRPSPRTARIVDWALRELVHRFERDGIARFDEETAGFWRTMQELAGASVAAATSEPITALDRAMVVDMGVVEAGAEGVSVQDAADLLGVSDTMVKRWCTAGKLMARKDGAGAWRIDLEDVQAMAATRKAGAA